MQSMLEAPSRALEAEEDVALDNFEQVIDAGTSIPSRWWPLCPTLTVLVTSRERQLNVRGERESAPLPA